MYGHGYDYIIIWLINIKYKPLFLGWESLYIINYVWLVILRASTLTLYFIWKINLLEKLVL